MNRSITVLALLAALVLPLAGCGEDDDAASAPSQAASSAFPVSIEHKFGSTTIESEPKRVVTVGYTEQDMVLALGVKPVGTREFLGGYDWRARPWAQDALGGEQPEVVGGQEINFESVAAQRPDLIVAINTGMTEGDYKKLSRIAPTVAQTDEYVDFGMPWDEQTLVIGRALGREEQARKLVEKVDADFAKARQEHPEFESASAILAYGGPDGYGAYTSEDTRSRFLADLGMKLPAEIDKIAGDSFFTELSQERFRLIDRDVVVMFGPQKEIENDDVFGRLKAVEQDRVVYLDLGDQFAGALGFASPLSLPYLLKEGVPQLAAAADGDPATKVEQPQ
jgi:iron complex transport system substrate-binding protein